MSGKAGKGSVSVIVNHVKWMSLAFTTGFAGCATVSFAPGPAGVSAVVDQQTGQQPSELHAIQAEFQAQLKRAGLPGVGQGDGMNRTLKMLISGEDKDAIAPDPVASYLAQAGDDPSVELARIAFDASALSEIVLRANDVCLTLLQASDPVRGRDITQTESVLTKGLKARDVLREAVQRIRDDTVDQEAIAALESVAALSDALSMLGSSADELAKDFEPAIG